MSTTGNIWNDGKGKLPEDKLLAYLEGKLSPEEQHEVEAWMAEEGMGTDALEGLTQLPAGEAKEMVSRLNHNLRTELTTKERRRKKPIKDNPLAWLAVIIILLLCIAAYIVIRLAVSQ
jgi:ferric-dicitrate binding protein FerR (iron transport regulator)